VDALRPVSDPARPALVAQVYSREIASDLKLTLLETYPDGHRVQIVRGGDTTEVDDLPLRELDRGDRFDHLTCVYLPAVEPLDNVATPHGLATIVAKLRAPDGCPWDREQDHYTLKPYLIEEAYEAVDALDRRDTTDLQEELGDLLLNILLHCQIASEEDDFTFTDVVRGISQKLIRRHPHVFGDLQLSTAQQVVQNWEKLKDNEREKEESMLDGLPAALPALAYARSLQERLSSLHLPADASTTSALLDTIRGDSDLSADSLGDALFALAYHAAALGVDPEEALRHANGRFATRVRRTETLARAGGASLPNTEAAVRNQLWVQTGG
jgi:tetrapyrrole methylase family protein/MazG family protein